MARNDPEDDFERENRLRNIRDGIVIVFIMVVIAALLAWFGLAPDCCCRRYVR